MALCHFAFPPEANGENVWGFVNSGAVMGAALADFIESLADDEEFLTLLGCREVSQLRSHSIRKGILTWLIGQDEGVDFYAVMKRAGYKITEKIREYIYARGGKDASLARSGAVGLCWCHCASLARDCCRAAEDVRLDAGRPSVAQTGVRHPDGRPDGRLGVRSSSTRASLRGGREWFGACVHSHACPLHPRR